MVELEVKTEARPMCKDDVEQGQRYNEKSWGKNVKTWQYVSKKGKEISMIGVGVFRADMSISAAKVYSENITDVTEAIASELPKSDTEKLADALAELAELKANK